MLNRTIVAVSRLEIGTLMQRSQRSTGSLVSIDFAAYDLSIRIFATDHDSVTMEEDHNKNRVFSFISARNMR